MIIETLPLSLFPMALTQDFPFKGGEVSLDYKGQRASGVETVYRVVAYYLGFRVR
jgi:hypothetical protein